MKLAALFVSLSAFLVASCNAQASHIGLPHAGDTVHAGQNVTVQIVRPNSIQGSREVGLAIGILPCQSTPCPTADAQMGIILYTGPFTPALHEIPGNPYQNFSLAVPSTADGFPIGPASIQVARLHLIGAGPSPILETNSVVVNVVA